MDVCDVHVRIDVGLTEAADGQPPPTGSRLEGIPTPSRFASRVSYKEKDKGADVPLCPGKRIPTKFGGKNFCGRVRRGYIRPGKRTG